MVCQEIVLDKMKEGEEIEIKIRIFDRRLDKENIKMLEGVFQDFFSRCPIGFKAEIVVWGFVAKDFWFTNTLVHGDNLAVIAIGVPFPSYSLTLALQGVIIDIAFRLAQASKGVLEKFEAIFAGQGDSTKQPDSLPQFDEQSIQDILERARTYKHPDQDGSK